MEAIMLISAVKNTSSIANFVLSGGLKTAISDIVGDVHLDTAKFVLESSKISDKPRDRINSVITHLEVAHIAYTNLYTNVITTKAYFNHQEIKNSIHKDIWVCCLSSICYKWLNDTKMVKQWLNYGNIAYESEEYISQLGNNSAKEVFFGTSAAIVGLFNLKNWTLLDKVTPILKSEFNEFKNCILK